MARPPTVTVGVPVYNGERYVGAALDSFLTQTWDDFELIVSDNASTDGTEAICRAYAAADSRVRYYRSSTNVGVARNYRRVFELSSSAYFKWASADDVVEPQFLQRCLDVLQHYPDVVLAYAKTRLVDDAGTTIRNYEDNLHLTSESPARRFLDVQERLRLANAVQGVIRSDVLRRTRLMGSYVGSDCIFIAELALHGKFHEVPAILFSRRFHSQAYSSITNPASRLQYYNPGDSSGVVCYHWRRLWELGRIIERSPIPRGDKMQLRMWLLKSAIWGRRELAREAWIAARSITIENLPTVPPRHGA